MKVFFRDDKGQIIGEGDKLIFNTWISSSGPWQGEGIVYEDKDGIFWVEGGGRKERLRSLANCLVVESLPVEDACERLKPGIDLYWTSGRAIHRL